MATRTSSCCKAGQHIYNQWLADVCSIEPERHIGLMHLPMWDMRGRDRGAGVGAVGRAEGPELPVPKPYMQPTTIPRWDPFFSGVRGPRRDALQPRWRRGERRHVPSGRDVDRQVRDLDDERASARWTQLVFGGVFERHPKLRLVTTESPGLWWQFVLKEMDSIYLTDTRELRPGGEGASAAAAERVRRRAGVDRRRASTLASKPRTPSRRATSTG